MTILATLEIGGFANASEALRFVHACGFALRPPKPDPTRVIGCAIMARYVDRIGSVHMLRKGVTLRFDARAARIYLPHIMATLDAAHKLT
jgi:hypothetical protein